WWWLPGRWWSGRWWSGRWWSGLLSWSRIHRHKQRLSTGPLQVPGPASQFQFVMSFLRARRRGANLRS
ncbi:uncharacterized protein METZ01_LOCUS161708, partial [marine metagenome]